MIRLLRFIIFGDGHKHKWITEDASKINYYSGSERHKRPEDMLPRRSTMRYIYRCEVCGLRKIQIFREDV